MKIYIYLVDTSVVDLRVQYITSLKSYDIYGDHFIELRNCEINEKMSETL